MVVLDTYLKDSLNDGWMMDTFKVEESSDAICRCGKGKKSQCQAH